MKKYIMITLTLLVVFALAVPAFADKEVQISASGRGDGKTVTVNFNFPLGFPSWREETSGTTFEDPTLVLIDKIKDVQLEDIYQDSRGGHVDYYPANFYESKGHLIIKGKLCAQSGDFIQILVTTWDGSEYELAIDKAWMDPGVNDMLKLKGLHVDEIWDGTWGVQVN